MHWIRQLIMEHYARAVCVGKPHFQTFWLSLLITHSYQLLTMKQLLRMWTPVLLSVPSVFFRWLSVTLTHSKALMLKGFVLWRYRSGEFNARTVLCVFKCVVFDLIWFDLTIAAISKKPNVETDGAQAEHVSLKGMVLLCTCRRLDWLVDLHAGFRGVVTADVRVTAFLRSLTISMYGL